MRWNVPGSRGTLQRPWLQPAPSSPTRPTPAHWKDATGTTTASWKTWPPAVEPAAPPPTCAATDGSVAERPSPCTKAASLVAPARWRSAPTEKDRTSTPSRWAAMWRSSPKASSRSCPHRWGLDFGATGLADLGGIGDDAPVPDIHRSPGFWLLPGGRARGARADFLGCAAGHFCEQGRGGQAGLVGV